MVKHSSNTRILSRTESDTTVFVKNSTPFISALKRIDKLLEKFDKTPTNYKKYQQGDFKKVKYLSVKAMGRAMEKAVSVGLHYQQNSGYQVDYFTGTVQVVDEIETEVTHKTRGDSDDEAETELQGRDVSFIEVKIWLKRK